MRFCSRCGFLLEGAMVLLAHGGMIPQYQPPEERGISPRKRGVKQGALLLLLGAVLVPAMGVLYGFTNAEIFGFFAALTAVVFFIGGPLRMLYAGLFEEGAKTYQVVMPQSYVAPAIPPAAARVSALPPAASKPTSTWRQRPQTAEIRQPPSVTDGTTRLLEKQKPESE
jgi:hypothetical protein